MSLVQQFLKSFREEASVEPGLFEKADGTVWLRNPDMSESQVTGGGGSQPFGQAFPFTHATANILTGAALWTPPIGTFISGGYPALLVSITTGFNGTTPMIEVGVIVSGSFEPLSSGFAVGTPDPPTPANAVDTSFNDIAASISFGTNYAAYQTGTDPIAVRLSDGASGDPGSTVGVGRLIPTVFGVPA